MKKISRSTLLILLCIIIIMGIFLVFASGIIEFSSNRSSKVSLIQDKLVELSEWTTLKYEYSNVIISRTEQSISLFGTTDINYAETIKLIGYSGYIKAGTDLSKAQITYDKLTKKLFVKVSKSKILDNVVETEKTKVEDVKGDIFSDYPTQIVFDEINASKKILEEEKIKEGFLEEADRRISILLTSFLQTNGFEEVVIEFY